MIIMENEQIFDRVFYSSGGFDMIQNYLCMLYGRNRGSYRNNIERYLHSEEYRSQCARAESLDDIPEINEKQIRELIVRESCFLKRAEDLVRYFDENEVNGDVSPEDNLSIAAALGLYFSDSASSDADEALFPHAVNLSVNSIDTKDRMISHVILLEK